MDVKRNRDVYSLALRFHLKLKFCVPLQFLICSVYFFFHSKRICVGFYVTAFHKYLLPDSDEIFTNKTVICVELVVPQLVVVVDMLLLLFSGVFFH